MCGHLLSRAAAFAGLAVVFVFPPLTARADFESDKRDCHRQRTPQTAIAACTRLLGSGRLFTHNQAIVYVNRGAAYSNLKQYRRAIQDFNKALRLKLTDPAATGKFDNLSLEQLQNRVESKGDKTLGNPRKRLSFQGLMMEGDRGLEPRTR
jgi:tetratricopeptide (TPR) repeat protein